MDGVKEAKKVRMIDGGDGDRGGACVRGCVIEEVCDEKMYVI